MTVKCAECGKVITDEDYLAGAKNNELKFCSISCAYHAWGRGIHKYAQRHNRVKRAAAVKPTAEKKQDKPVVKKKQDKPTVKGMTNASSLVGKRGKALTVAQKNEIIELHKQGYNRRQISIATGRSINTVKSLLERYAKESECG